MCTPAPSPWILRFAPLAPPGAPVLDVAAGSGRHARFFLGRGHPVVAVDVDVHPLEDLRHAPGLEIVAADLEDGTPWPLPGRRFGAVVVTHYLWRPLLPALVDAVAAGGVLLYETFARGQEELGPPRRPEFLLEPGELIEAVRDQLQIVAYEHGRLAQPRPAIKQRICAIRSSQPAVLPPA